MASQERIDLRRGLVRYGPLIAVGALLVGHSLVYNFVTDDAYISFVYSRNLADSGALTFNPGYPPVEGYTNFLWTFLLGVLAVIGLPPETMSLVLGAAFAVGTLVVVMRLSAVLFGGQSHWDHLAGLLLAASSGYACWTSGGLETQMFTFWVALALYGYIRADGHARAWRWTAVALALAATTRPEGLLVVAVLGVHRLGLNLLRDRRIRPHIYELSGAGIFLVLWLPWFLWRWSYYGYPFPNTYYVKAAGEATAAYDKAIIQSGLHYVWQWARQSCALYAAPVALVGALVCRPRTPRFVFGSAATVLAALYLAYTVSVGGDFMGLHRFVMPLFVLVAVTAVAGVRLLVSLVPEGRLRSVAAWVGALAMVLGHGIAQARLTSRSAPAWRSCPAGDSGCIAEHRRRFWPADNGIDTPSYLAAYAHDRARIGKHIRDCVDPDDFAIYGGVGAKPYYAGLRGIDVFGLVSEEIAHQVPRTRPRPGHNKWGPDPLLHTTYEPEYVFHCYTLVTDPAAAKKPLRCGHYWRRNGYQQVTLFIPGLVERGEYYSFFVRDDRVDDFTARCEGVVR